MAFRDLEEGVAELFGEANGFQVTQLDRREAQILAGCRRKDNERHRALDQRLSFELKVKRARERRWAIRLLPREVSCVECRLAFGHVSALHGHWYGKHIKRNQ